MLIFQIKYLRPNLNTLETTIQKKYIETYNLYLTLTKIKDQILDQRLDTILSSIKLKHDKIG